nr:CHAP domain-containing protein [Salmonella enterica]
MSWNKHRAVEYARTHAGSSSRRQCAHYVSNAIRAGGARLINTNYAKDMGPVSGSPQEGDVAVIQPTYGRTEGHACIYDGHGAWYSDFKQRTMYPGDTYRAQHPPYQLYRHN